MRKLPFAKGLVGILGPAAIAAAGAAMAAHEPLSAWISGGVGLEERSQFLTYRKEFNLRLVYAVRKTGHYLADVETGLMEPDGTVLLNIRSEGPFVFARLAPGRYTISATFRGETQRREVDVREGRDTVLHLYWDDPASQEGRSRKPEGFYRH